MSDVIETKIPIRVECDEAGSGGAIWNVKNVIDERLQFSIGDIGIYDFDDYSNFSETLMDAVINTLEEIGEFKRRENFYSVELNIVCGGSRLGSASRYLYGHQLLPKEKFRIIEVLDDLFPKLEQMGTKFKFWYEDKDHGFCLFKEGHPNTGEDWAERVAAELCKLLGMPHAIYRLAVWRGRRGVITQNFLGENESYSAGNEVLFRQDASYPKEERKAKKHSVENIFAAFQSLKVEMPKEPSPTGITTAKQVFLGYLMLDAWISNTDRHHENWATIRRFENNVLTDRLAPTHDHAASLGCILQDDEKIERLTTKDVGRSIKSYVSRSKARSAIYANEADSKPLSLIDAFRVASSLNPQASKIWLKKLENVTIDSIKEVFERIPESRISETSKEFAIRMLEINRQRLLELKR